MPKVYDPNRRFEVAQKRRELRERALAYKGGKCEICGYSKSPAAMDFHHIELADKEFTISSRMTSWDAIVKELDKTALLCATCHREVHDGYHPSFLVDYGEDAGGADWGDDE